MVASADDRAAPFDAAAAGGRARDIRTPVWLGRQPCGDHESGGDCTNDRKLAKHYLNLLGADWPWHCTAKKAPPRLRCGPFVTVAFYFISLRNSRNQADSVPERRSMSLDTCTGSTGTVSQNRGSTACLRLEQS